MNVFEAFAAAADHIAAHPGRYNYMCSEIPDSLEGEGCLIGWINYFQGASRYPDSPNWRGIAPAAIGTPDSAEFYDRIRGIDAWGLEKPENAARALRRYAMLYYDELKAL